MRTTIKLLSLLTAGLLMTACQTERQAPPSIGSTYDMQNSLSGKGSYEVIMDNGKKKIMKVSTDLDVLSEDSWGCCCDADTPKEAAIVRTNRSLEIRLGDYSPNISIQDVSVSCDSDNSSIILVDFDLRVEHSAGPNANLPSVDVPLFFSAADIPSQEVYSHGHAMARVDMNKPFETQRVRARFDTSDLKARNLKGWSLLVGIMKSAQNRNFENRVEDEKEQKIAEAAGPYEINKTRTGTIPTAPRGVDYNAPDLVEK